MTWSQWIPNLLSWRACEDLQECLDNVKDQVSPDEYMDAIEDEIVLVCHEKSLILQKDRELCDGDDGSVDDRADVRGLDK